MTLRDYFAGQALAGICSRESQCAADYSDVAFRAYEIANAMIFRREVTA
jgi:hypothetical protein